MMRFLAILFLILAAGCTSKVSDSGDGSGSAGGDTTGAGEDTPGASEPDTAVGDVAEPTDAVATMDVADPADPGPAAPDTPPQGDAGTPAKCDCDSAEMIQWRKDISHSSCKTPGGTQAQRVAICKMAFSKTFKTGDTFGVEGCKFVVTCPE